MYYGNVSATDSGSLANVYGAGIVGFWPFSEGAGTTTYDRSGNNNNGTLYNSPAWTAGGRYGNAISFTTAGANYVTSQNNVGITGAQSRSLSFWVKVASIAARNSFVSYGTGPDSTMFGTGSDYAGSNKLYFAGYGNDLVGTTVLSNNIWYYVVITYDGSLVSIYLNGAFQISGAKTLNTTDSPISFAKQLAADWLFLDGLIDETRLYNRVLTVDEIASGYVAPANDPAAGAPGAEQ
jgi:hypothetical protein